MYAPCPHPLACIRRGIRAGVLLAVLGIMPGLWAAPRPEDGRKLPLHVTVRGTWTETRDCTFDPAGGECRHCQVEGHLVATWDADVVAQSGGLYTNPEPGRLHVEYLEREFCRHDGEGDRKAGRGDGPLISPLRLGRGPDYGHGEGGLVIVEQPSGGSALARSLLVRDFRPSPQDLREEGRAQRASLKGSERPNTRRVHLQAPFRTSGHSAWQMVDLLLLVGTGPGMTQGSVAWEERGAVNDTAWSLRAVGLMGLAGGANWALQEGTEGDVHRTTRYVVGWSFEPVDEGEATLEIDGYEDWIPEGSLAQPGQAGNHLQVRVKAHKAGHPDQPLDTKVRFTFSLEGTSMEPGVCMNWPPSPTPPDYGLKLLQARNPDLEVLGPDQARTREAGQAADLTVSAVSYGAWSRLKVAAETVEGRKLKVRFQGNPVEAIPLPEVEGDGHIARAYLKRHGLLGKAGDWDGEQDPPGNGFDGDGLTLYEEYRGFAVKGRHVTGHPAKKDVFIHDETGQAEGGINRFEALTGLVVHRVDAEEMGSRRVVNRNHGAGPHAVDQHGIRLTKGPRSSDAEVQGDDRDMGSPPRAWSCVSLPFPARPSTQQDALVAHEICHCVGVQHHGDDLASARWFWALQDGTWVLLEKYFSDGAGKVPKPLAPVVIQAFFEGDSRPLTREDPWLANHQDPDGSLGTRMLVFGQGSPFSGNDSCIMRYVEDVHYAFSPSPTSKVRYIVDPSQTPKGGGTLLCRSPEGTGVNAPGHRPIPRAGPGVRGGCQDQIVVNDRYSVR